MRKVSNTRSLICNPYQKIDELTLIQGEKSGFQATGTLPLVNNIGAPVEINFDTKFSNLDLDMLILINANSFIKIYCIR